MRGSPPANQKGGRGEAQHLWLSLAKLAHMASAGSGGDAAPPDPSRWAEVQRRLQLAEARERLLCYLPAESVSWWVGGLAGEFVGPRLAGIRYAVGSAWNFGWVGERSCDVLAFCFTRVFLGRK